MGNYDNINCHFRWFSRNMEKLNNSQIFRAAFLYNDSFK